MKNQQIYENIKKYAAELSAAGYLRSGYVGASADDGLYITTPEADFADLKEDQVAFVTEKGIEQIEGNFRAAAVLILCALKAKKKAGAAAIVDSESILSFSGRRKTLPPVLDDMAQVDGVSVRTAIKNTAVEVVAALSGMRNACFLPGAGALVTGRTLAEVYTATLVLDKAATCYILAEPKGGAKHHNFLDAYLEHIGYTIKYSKKNQSSQKAAEEGKEVDLAEQPSAIVTDELKKLADEVKAAGVRLVKENLVQGTWGNIAVRIDDKTMLATPSALDYEMLQPEQMAVVDMETMEWKGSNKPTSEKGIHAKLLLTYPESNATVHTHPFYGSILAAMRQPLPVPEKYRAVLGDVIPVSKVALPGTGKLVKNTSEAMGDAPACFMANHGVIVRGKDLEDAFAICRALEDACRDYLLSDDEKACEAVAEDAAPDREKAEETVSE